jgi:prephenate dehydrogenase
MHFTSESMWQSGHAVIIVATPIQGTAELTEEHPPGWISAD